MNKLLRIPDHLAGAISALAERNRRSFNSEVIVALEQYLQSRKDNQMQYDSRDGKYHGTLANGDEVIVEGDEYAEAEQEGAPQSELTPAAWAALEGVNDNVKVVKK